MAYKTFFFQEGIYQNKKTKSRFSFFNVFNPKKIKSGASAFFSTSYIANLDSAIFRDGISSTKKKHARKTLNFQRFFTIFTPIVLCAVFLSISVFVYFFFASNTSVLDSLVFQNEESASHFMEELANIRLQEFDDTVLNLPQMMKEVSYQEYIVKTGDTVGGIAYKMGLKKIGTIFSVNNITNARRIMSGTKLLVPSMDGIMYEVKKNDSIEGIANSFNIKMEDLLDANDINEETIEVGRRIFIPGASMPFSEIKRILGEFFIYPIKGRLTSPFGYRRDPFTGRRSFHSGIDLAAPTGTPIKVVMDGVVSEMNFSRIFGNYLIVTHSNGYQSLYGHVNSFKAKRGQKVEQGDIIAFVGNTGMSTGPHVHLSIYKNGKLLDPLTLLK